MKVFAFVGPKGSGKDTAADFVKEALGADTSCLSVSLADGLKHAAAALHGLDADLFYNLASKDAPVPGTDSSPRDLVIRLSETLAPALGDDFHVSTRLRRLASRESYDVLLAEQEHLKILEMDSTHEVLDNTGSLEDLRAKTLAITQRHA